MATSTIETTRTKSAGASGRKPSEATKDAGRSGVGEPQRSGDTLGTSQTVLPNLHEVRLSRFLRANTSSRWLIAEARTNAGKEPYAIGITAKSDEWVRAPRPARCHWRVAIAVGVMMKRNQLGRRAHFSGVEYCSSVWACPSCSAVIRSQRANELDAAYAAVIHKGLNPGLFMTLTLRHKLDTPLDLSLDSVQTAWRELQQNGTFRRLCERLKIAGIIRATEITYSFRSGWHPHVHCWIITKERVTDEALTEARSKIANIWASLIAKASNGDELTPNQQHGCDLRRVTSKGMAAYIAKTQDDKAAGQSRRLANEMMRFDLKQGRAQESIMPFELLDMDESKAALWCEYVAATKGRKASEWTRGLKAMLDLNEKTDEQIISQEAAMAQLQFAIHGHDYDRATPADKHTILTVTEQAPENAAEHLGATLDARTSDLLDCWIKGDFKTYNKLLSMA